MTVGTLERVFAELGIRTNLQTWWEGAELDRLLAGRHSAMHDAVARMFESLPEWTIAPEVSFAITASAASSTSWRGTRRAERLLVIELKTELVDVQETVGTLDRKRRLAAQVAAERGWKPAVVSVWLVIADSRTNQRRVAAHRAMLRAAYPVDGRTIGRWLAGTLRSDRGALVPAFHSRHECESGVRPGPTRQSVGGRAWTPRR